MEGDKGPVCVTGGTGFIGSSLIKRLLDRGYNVRTTVRSNAGKPLNSLQRPKKMHLYMPDPDLRGLIFIYKIKNNM